MWSVYSLLLLLFLVEASLGRYYCPDPMDVTFRPINPASLDLYRKGNMTLRDFMKDSRERDPSPNNGNVTIRWDIMNETGPTYTANVTIFNYMKNHDVIKGPWKLKWFWNHEEILFNTLGATCTQHGSNVFVGRHGVWGKGAVTIVDLPSSQTKEIVPNCCKGGLIPSWFEEADLAKSSSSFQISVARVISYIPPCLVSLTTPGSKYRCDTATETTSTPGYLNTWTTHCELYDPKKLYKIHHREEFMNSFG